MTISTATSAVARIAFATSDVVVDCQPPLPETSPFAQTYKNPSDSKTTTGCSPTVISIPHGADSGSSLLHHHSANAVSYTVSSDRLVLARILPHLPELSSRPVVLHIAVRGDLSDALLLRAAVPFFLYSSTVQRAHDHALLASRIARTEKRAVVHAFEEGEGDIGEVIHADKIRAFLLSPKRASRHLNGNGNSIGDHSHSNPANGAGSDNPTNGHVESHATPSEDMSSTADYEAYESASLATLSLVRRAVRPWTQSGEEFPHTVVITLGQTFSFEVESVSVIDLHLVSPLSPSKLLQLIPWSPKRVIVLEQLHRWDTKWTPLFVEVAGAVQHLPRKNPLIVHSGTFGDVSSITHADILKFIRHAKDSPPNTRLSLGDASSSDHSSSIVRPPHVPAHESSYTTLLSHLFADRFEISNSPQLVTTLGAMATSPEFALGRVSQQIATRGELVKAVQKALEEPDNIPADLHSFLSKWILHNEDAVKCRELCVNINPQLDSLAASTRCVTGEGPIAKILSLRSHFKMVSRWIIGSDAWSYDLGSSGMHHLIASGLNVNILIIDNVPYSARGSADPTRRKRDIGLYAMNHADVYVASVAVYSSYSQVLQSLMEADRFNGPSVILAYLPYQTEDTPALEVLKETKLAVDSGYWPLYRWDPSKEKDGKEPFTLDSDAIKNELKEFLDRHNHLSQLTRPKPDLAAEIVSSLGESLQEARKKRAQQAYDELLNAVSGKPLLVLYASDGGAAEKKAKRLANRAKARGLASTIATIDSYSIEDVAKEEYVAFVTSVAGQGEPPQNGRTFFKAVNATVGRGEKPLSEVKYSVFGMGDSHYWPRPEDAHYYNRPGKELFAKLEVLGAQPFAEIGLGNDQDADGPETGYKIWEPLVWKALGVDAVEVTEAEPEPITNEHMKIASNYLRGTIAEGLEDTSTGAIAPTDGQLTKFHGIYQQDDRDIRDERQAEGVEPAYSFMIRVRMPGGVCDGKQWLAMDQIADEHGNGTFKITTRQTFQFHGVIKRHLKPSIQAINRALLDTLAACGDVNRNVIVSAIPTLSQLHREVYEFAKTLSERLLPRTSAYHEIWLDKKLVAGDAVKDFEPLYGEYYLPRKFKIAVAVPPTNDVDVFTNDVGFIAIVDDHGKLAGFNVTAGGGMGVTHGSKKTYPRLGSILGFCTPEQGHEVAEQIMLTQRDNGNRADRKNARLKYTIDRMGLDNFKAEVERRLGWKLQPPRHYVFDRNIDDFGWSVDQDGRHNFLLFIENGRVQDEPGCNFKTGLRELAKILKGTFRMTANQHIMLAGIETPDLLDIKRVLAEYKLDNLNHTGLRLSSSACVAFPTCGLAMAESERYLPLLINKVEAICEENGLRNDSIVMRMTGCPNGCARPYVAEVAFVGKAPGTYLMLLGGGYYGERLNKIYRESVTEVEILAILKPMIKHYALERRDGERFGDFVIRAGYIAPTTAGKEWYDDMGGSGIHREVTVAA
ncbi:sulfite reductase subunit beta [Rickenella mellea]|uniref:assimilatory sulfite reductase (NADPH) n=1 Tax=Rickenella mellea TaxID=50990 RepID=A0A4Y7Q7P1_9AGAM|nr:sulfite reductase subunit beta [Rickenella mellea]